MATRHFAACGANRLSTHFDNKQVWKRFLDPDFIQQNFPTRAPFQVVLELARIYIQLLDGEAQVERDLGCLRALLESHAGPMHPATVDDNVVLVLSGPTDATDLATPACSGLSPTHYLNECAALWRELHGARVRCAPKANCKKRSAILASKRHEVGFSLLQPM